MDYLQVLKDIKSQGIVSQFDWGMDRIIEIKNKIYTFTYRDKPNSKNRRRYTRND
jgi:hypothetical protein